MCFFMTKIDSRRLKPSKGHHHSQFSFYLLSCKVQPSEKWFCRPCLSWLTEIESSQASFCTFMELFHMVACVPCTDNNNGQLPFHAHLSMRGSNTTCAERMQSSNTLNMIYFTLSLTAVMNDDNFDAWLRKTVYSLSSVLSSNNGKYTTWVPTLKCI